MAVDSMTKEIRLMELRKVTVSPLTSDVAGSEGAPVYGEAVQVPGILSLQITPQIETKTLYGDSVVKDVYSRVTSAEIQLENSLMSVEALAVMQGGKVTKDGEPGSEVKHYTFTKDNATPPYFKIEGDWYYAGSGIAVAKVVIYKVKCTQAPDITINDSSGDFGSLTATCSAVSCDSNGKWIDYDFYVKDPSQA